METNEILTKPPSNWQPIIDRYTLAILGKLSEEVSELGAATSRCIIQGIDESEPNTGKINRIWLEQEIADVMVMTTIAITRLDLDNNEILKRFERKISYLESWFDFLNKKETENNEYTNKS